MVFCSAINCSNNCNSDVSTFKFLKNKKNKERKVARSEGKGNRFSKYETFTRLGRLFYTKQRLCAVKCIKAGSFE